MAAPRTLEQIMAEMDPGYAASRSTIQNQQSGLQGQQTADVTNLENTKVDAYRNIDDNSAARGVLYGGAPSIAQSQYLKDSFTPAYTNIQNNYSNKRTSLEEALNSLNREQRTGAMGIFQQEKDRAQQQAQWEAQMAEQRRQAAATAGAGIGAYLGGSNNAPQSPKSAQIQRTANGGFNFMDGTGRAISAAAYSQLTGVEYRKLLSDMATAGDKNAQVALKYVGNDAKFGNVPQQYAGALSALGATGSYQQAAQNNKYVPPTNRETVAKKLGVPSNSPLVDRYIASGNK